MVNHREITQAEALKISADNGAWYEGHFVGTQGKKPGLGLHMPQYFDNRTLLTKPHVIAELARGVAHLLKDDGLEVIAGMPLGAYTLGHEVAKCLEIDYVMPEKLADGSLVLAREAFRKLVKGRRVGLVEDTINAGDTVGKGVAAIESAGGDVVAIGAIINRGPAEVIGQVPIRALIRQKMAALSLEDCLSHGQCAEGEPINRRPGHGHHLEELVQSGQVASVLRFI